MMIRSIYFCKGAVFEKGFVLLQGMDLTNEEKLVTIGMNQF